jgi:hypothetical protein
LTTNIAISNAFLVNSKDQAITPDIGEQFYVQANFTTQNLPTNSSYRVGFSVDGVVLDSGNLTWGAGLSGTGNWFIYWGAWFASPGQHTVTVTLDPDQSVAESTYSDNTATFNFTPVHAPDLPNKFITPLGGTPFQTWGFVNYVDVNPQSPGYADFMGGDYTYDGHRGHDMTLANFYSMDAGVPDYAAAAGKVVVVQDGNYDRNTSFNTSPANYVEIDHGNGWHTFYYHFRTDSILVHVGDNVVAGQILGLAGSSGDSTLAHLHFEVQHNGDVVEPEYDPTTFWLNPLPYQANVRAVLDSGISGSSGTVQPMLNAEERPPNVSTFSQAAGQPFTAWFQGYTRPNDAAAFKFYNPSGAEDVPLDFSFTTGEDRGGYYYYFNNLPSNLAVGTWRMDVVINGAVLASDHFTVAAQGAPTALVQQAGTYITNGRTTPINFGTVAQGSSPPQLTFTISNLGSAALSPSNLQLPTGYSLVGSFPASVAAHGTAMFTLQMSTATSLAYAGAVSFQTNDPNAAHYTFAVKGSIAGGNTGEIHGQVYKDINDDGIENGGETGLVGWSVSLLDPTTNIVLATTTTSYNGYYAFLNLAPGTYRVLETPMTGWTQTTANPADVVVGSSDVLESPFGVGQFFVTNTLDSGAGSLRQTIIDATRVSGMTHQIQFALPFGPQTITLLSPLPNLSDPLVVVLDASQDVSVVSSTANAWDHYNALTEIGAGILNLSEVGSFAGNIQVNGGSLKLSGPTTPTFSAGVSAAVTGSGVLELGGIASDLTARVDIANSNTTGAGIVVSGTNQVVGGINGVGVLLVNPGGALTANHVDQTVLIIGGSAGDAATLTIAPSDSNGNPLESPGTGPFSNNSVATSESGASPAVTRQSVAAIGAAPIRARTGNRSHADALDAVLSMSNGFDTRRAELLDDQWRGGDDTVPPAPSASAPFGPSSGIVAISSPPTFKMASRPASTDESRLPTTEWVGADTQTRRNESSADGSADGLIDLLAMSLGRFH